MKTASLTLVVLAVLSLTGCGVFIPAVYSENLLDSLTPSMSKDEVIKILGRPDYVRIDDGEMLLWEYKLYGKNESLRSLLFCPITLGIACLVPPPAHRKDPYWVVLVDDRLCMWGNPDVVSTRKKCMAYAKGAVAKEAKRDLAGWVVSVVPVHIPPPLSSPVYRLAVVPLSDAKGYELPAWLDLTLSFLRSRHPNLLLVERETLQPVLDEAVIQYSGRVDDATTIRIGRMAGADTLLTYRIEPVPDHLAKRVSLAGGGVPGSVEIRLIGVESGTTLFRQTVTANALLPPPSRGNSWVDSAIHGAHQVAVQHATSHALAALAAVFGDNPLGLVPDLTVSGDGVQVFGVLAGGPANSAGIKSGDRIVMVDGRPFANWTQPITPPARLTILRNGLTLEIAVATAGQRH